MGVVGAAIKGFGKALKRNKASKQVFDHTRGKPFPESIQRHMKAADKRSAGMKKAGYKKEPYAMGKKTKSGSIKLKEMWSYNPYKKAKKKGIDYKKIAKKTAPIGAAAAAGVAYGRHREKSKTDVPEEIKALVTGTRKVSKNQKKFKK